MNSIQELATTPTHWPLPDFRSHRAGLALQGWKNIASELDRGVRTVQRWERTLGLPVHRICEEPQSPVFAFADELQSWLRKRANPQGRPDSTISKPSPHEQENQEQENLGQEIRSEILSRIRKATLAGDGQHKSLIQSSSNGRNLHAIIEFLVSDAARPLPGNCGQCHSSLQIVKAYFGIFGTGADWTMPVVFCPVCDIGTIASSGAKQAISSFARL